MLYKDIKKKAELNHALATSFQGKVLVHPALFCEQTRSSQCTIMNLHGLWI